MKSFLIAALLGFALVQTAIASTEWKSDFEAAKTQARKENKPLLLNFTGSDWCGWCIRMKKETLDQTDFRDYAAKHFVLVEVDFPSRKKLPAAQQKANDALKAKYNVEGFPTFLVLDADGKVLGRQEGYLKGGPGAFIGKLDGWKGASK